MAAKKELEIIYVEMPISIEQKKEYNRRGYRVVDAKFAPEEYEAPFVVDLAIDTVGEAEKPKRTRRRTETED